MLYSLFFHTDTSRSIGSRANIALTRDEFEDQDKFDGISLYSFKHVLSWLWHLFRPLLSIVPLKAWFGLINPDACNKAAVNDCEAHFGVKQAQKLTPDLDLP